MINPWFSSIKKNPRRLVGDFCMKKRLLLGAMAEMPCKEPFFRFGCIWFDFATVTIRKNKNSFTFAVVNQVFKRKNFVFQIDDFFVFFRVVFLSVFFVQCIEGLSD